jgi:uncharacterized Zn-binding protein involved in type VI secretion
MHTCPRVEPGGAPHVGGPIFAGSADVFIGHLPAARVGDAMVCFPVGPTDAIKAGASTVLINHRSAARRSDPGSHIGGDVIVQGCPSVLIGDTPQASVLRGAARRGTPFCEECERRRREREAAAEAAGEAVDDEPVAPDGGDRHARRRRAAAWRARPDDGCHGDPRRPGPRGRRRRARRRPQGRPLRRGVPLLPRARRAAPSSRRRSGRTSAVSTIDRPVEVVDVAGRTLYQRGFPGSAKQRRVLRGGPGHHARAARHLERRRRREGRPARARGPRPSHDRPYAEQKTPGLQARPRPRSPTSGRSARSGDRPAQIVDCRGGGTQIMIPRAFHGASTTVVG